MNIQWFPGHMSKTRRLLEENLKMVDVVIELLDARIPVSSKNPEIDSIVNNKSKIVVLNKATSKSLIEEAKLVREKLNPCDYKIVIADILSHSFH